MAGLFNEKVRNQEPFWHICSRYIFINQYSISQNFAHIP